MSTEQDHDVKFQMIKPKRLKGRFQKKSNIISFNRVIDIGPMSPNPFFVKVTIISTCLGSLKKYQYVD
jgi:hypothetical protein